MSDLVERLRNEERRVRKFLGPITATQFCKEAADEIERLRALDSVSLVVRQMQEIERLRAVARDSAEAATQHQATVLELRVERDALREYYEAVQTHPVNYSAGNIDRVKAAIAAINNIDAALKEGQ